MGQVWRSEPIGLSRGLRKVATEEILVEIGVRCQEVYIVELLQQRYIENLSMLKYFLVLAAEAILFEIQLQQRYIGNLSMLKYCLVLATEAILFEIGGSCRALKRDLARK